MILIDAKEKSDFLKAGCDATVSLAYSYEGSMFFYDFRVEPLDGGEPIRIERKVFPSDFIGSWFGEYLDRQLQNVDLLLIEFDFLAGWAAHGDDGDGAKTKDQKSRAFKHLVNIAFKMPVTVTDSPQHTLAVLRYLEATPHARAGTINRAKKTKKIKKVKPSG